MQIRNFKEILNDLIPESEKSNSLSSFYNINYDISTFLVEYRVKHNISQKQLAVKLGVSHYLIYKYENGDYNFSLMQICEICDKLNVEFEMRFKSKEK